MIRRFHCFLGIALSLVAAGCSSDETDANGARDSDAGADASGSGGADGASGGATSHAGANAADGGKTGSAGGGGSAAGGATPGGNGGASPGAGGAIPGAGGASPGAGGTNPGAGGTNPGDPDAAAPGGGSCDARRVLCRAAPPTCTDGEVPSVNGSCWGPCIPIGDCTCSAPADCPDSDHYTCHNFRQRCGPYLL